MPVEVRYFPGAAMGSHKSDFPWQRPDPPPLIMYLGVVPQVLGTLILGTFFFNVPKCGLEVLCAAVMLTWVHFLACLVLSF